MWISNYAIKKPIITTVVMVALVVFGVIALLKLEDRRVPRGHAAGRQRRRSSTRARRPASSSAS